MQRFGSEPFEIEESQLVLTPGKTFAEEAILHTPARMTVRALKLGGQVDVVFSEGAVAVFGEGDRDMHIHRHEVNVFREGECFEETAVACGMLRQSSLVALAGSIVCLLYTSPSPRD